MTALHLPLPPRELWPNTRPSVWGKAKATREYRTMCGWIAKAEGLKVSGSVTIQYLFRFNPRRRRDPDNLINTMKAALDGLRDAEIIPDDTIEDVTILPPTVETGVKNPEVIVTIAPNPPATKRLPREAVERVWEEETR